MNKYRVRNGKVYIYSTINVYFTITHRVYGTIFHLFLMSQTYSPIFLFDISDIEKDFCNKSLFDDPFDKNFESIMLLNK